MFCTSCCVKDGRAEAINAAVINEIPTYLQQPSSMASMDVIKPTDVSPRPQENDTDKSTDVSSLLETREKEGVDVGTEENKHGLSVRLVFRDPSNKQLKDIEFTKAPVGIDIRKRSPMDVRRVYIGSHADKVGVRAGWVVEKINGIDWTKEPDGSKIAYHAFVDAVSVLHRASNVSWIDVGTASSGSLSSVGPV